MTMVDDAVCDLGHAQDRGGDGVGCSKCRAQIKGRDDVFLHEHRRRCLRENGSRRIERLLDEDRRRVAPPPEKATTPVGWLDHERRCCSLEGATTRSPRQRIPARMTPDALMKKQGRGEATDDASKVSSITVR